MNIVVCIKQVPDAPNIRIDRGRMTIIRDGVESIINPLDRVALEAALDLKQKEGGTVSVLTMGPSQSEEALREAMAAGADQAILLTDPHFAGADTLATSKVIASAISRMDPFPDLILCGRQTIDSDTGHVGPQLAEELNLPQVCGVTEIHVEMNALVVKQLSDGFQNTYRVSLPALLTVSQGLNEQVRTVHHADFIIGPTGAAWTNLIFCRSGAKGLCWMADEFGDFSAYSSIASMVSVDLRDLTYKAGVRSTGKLYYKDYYIDIKLIEKGLSELFAERSKYNSIINQ